MRANAGAVMMERGQHSNIAEPREIVARTPAELADLWQQHAPGHPAPSVDFTASMVAAVFLGMRRSGGYDVEIVGVETEGRTHVVVYRTQQPGSGPATQVITSPYYIARLPRHDGPVRFRGAA